MTDLDVAYHDRAEILALEATSHPSAITPALDVDEPGWWIVYMYIGGRQVSWHISPADIHLFDHVQKLDLDAPFVQWDGHTTEEKHRRIREYVGTLA